MLRAGADHAVPSERAEVCFGVDLRQVALRRIEELAGPFRLARGQQKRDLEQETVSAFLEAGLGEGDEHAGLRLVERLLLDEPIEFDVIDFAYAHGFEAWAARRSKKTIRDWSDREFRRNLRRFLHENHENHDKFGRIKGLSVGLGYGIRDLQVRASDPDEQR